MQYAEIKKSKSIFKDIFYWFALLVCINVIILNHMWDIITDLEKRVERLESTFEHDSINHR